MRAQLDARLTGQHPHAALGQAIGRVPGHGPVFVHRADVDDAAAAALGDHLLGGELGPEEGALQVDVHDPFVLRLGGVEHRGPGLDAGVVDHDVEPAHLFDRPVDRASAGRRPCSRRPRPRSPGRRGRPPASRVPRWPPRWRRSRSRRWRRRRPAPGHGLADAGVAPGHDGDLSLERHRPFLSDGRQVEPPHRPTHRRDSRTARRVPPFTRSRGISVDGRRRRRRWHGAGRRSRGLCGGAAPPADISRLAVAARSGPSASCWSPRPGSWRPSSRAHSSAGRTWPSCGSRWALLVVVVSIRASGGWGSEVSRRPLLGPGQVDDCGPPCSGGPPYLGPTGRPNGQAAR